MTTTPGSIPYSSEREPPMQYWASVRFIFTSPNSWKNLLLCAVCVLIPVVGPMVLTGYLITIFIPKLNDPRPEWEGYPDFDFDRFTDFLTKGLWPFLVTLVAGLVVWLPAMLLFMVFFFVGAASASNNGVIGVALMGVGFVVMFVLILLATLILIPLQLRAGLIGEFGPSFDFGWVKDFLARTWRELLLSSLFAGVIAIPLVLVGYALCIVGVYPAMALLVIIQWHLHFQVYRIYLARGGMAVPIKWVPPPLPFAPPSGAPRG